MWARHGLAPPHGSSSWDSPCCLPALSSTRRWGHPFPQLFCLPVVKVEFKFFQVRFCQAFNSLNDTQFVQPSFCVVCQGRGIMIVPELAKFLMFSYSSCWSMPSQSAVPVQMTSPERIFCACRGRVHPRSQRRQQSERRNSKGRA